jgi:hypothetical protein|uniref:Uncharacterized protein n=1 Tax=Siphoviridae sp. ctM4P7 TaxID=2826256 RepID=A0A8S5MY89_9CAUD|nr:MAG TPA: hypothetical protein [Siphoviridae sp. ctM4P7]
MLQKAISYLVGLGEEAAKPEVLEIAGKTYCTKDLIRYGKEEKAEPLTASSLTSLIDYIKGRKEELRSSMILHVVSPTKVRLLSGLLEERDRETLFEVTTNPNGFEFDRYYSQEDFVINMQTAFVQSEETELILKVAGNVENKATANYGDDGCTQKTTIKRGIASREDVLVPNPVVLAPYRTFLEVEQPESKFVFRIKEGSGGEPNFKLVSADGGLWKYAAIKGIKEYLHNALQDEKLDITIIG